MIFAEHVKRIHTVIGRQALISQRSELIGKQTAVDRVIVHDQNHHIVIHRHR
ncbi:hypothetical protein D3C76_1840000 [compost metagenome]